MNSIMGWFGRPIENSAFCNLFIFSSQDTLLDAIRKTKVNFVRCILPVEIAGQTDSVDGEAVSSNNKETSSLYVPLVRNQLRSAEMLDAVRIHRQGGSTVASDSKSVS